ncbi:MAG: TonB-dependent receptor [Flavobacteriales bacterium]|nr:TonB-dependent receptor [Flavobacteriales bacterium]
MERIYHLVLLLFFVPGISLNAQTIKGKITSNGEVVPFANVDLEGNRFGVSADENGNYVIKNTELGHHHIIVSAIGMLTKKIHVDVLEGVNTIDISVDPTSYGIDQVVVTGTKTFKRKTESPVIVNVIDSRQLESVQACNLAEGLNFQPGIRIETDCQTCNYTQLRMNGLAGGYSQILINGRPIFSPLAGLYGMEQIPVNMIDRIEIVRGGGSSLYGSSSVGGVVNVITKLAKKNGFSFGYDYASINSAVDDKVLFGNSTVVAATKNSGATFFVNNRDREWYDHNNDNYSELPVLKDNAFGVNFFFLPSDNQKLELNLGSLHEYRYGGEMIDGSAHFSMQAEERVHDILLSNIDYQINFNDGYSSFISYLSSQQTQREHYTGIRPDTGTVDDVNHLSNPPYGISLNTTSQFGLQLNHKYENFFGSNVFTVGSEYTSDNIMDEISSYNYLVDQKVKTIGVFLQSDWDLTESIKLLSGSRFDIHSLLDNIVISPRISLLYKLQENTQFRISYSTGFRAPQAFDSDLHIAFAGGGISRIELADDLKEERSKSVCASYNYDKAASHYIYGLTLEGFYTKLDDAFYQDPDGKDEFGEVFVKRNGNGATVKGVNIEFRANYDQKIQIESGFTIQRSLYDNAVSYSDNLASKRFFLRTPNNYGYATIDYTPSDKFRLSTNLVHTGKMVLVHIGGAPEQENDEYKTSDVFNAIGVKATYIQKIERVRVSLEYSLGVKNLSNDYQHDFDSGKNRDSNFIYGPSVPRTFYVSLVMKSM